MIYILLSTWPILHLIKFGTLAGNFYMIDAFKISSLFLFYLCIVYSLFQKRLFMIGFPIVFWSIYFVYILINGVFNGSAVGVVRIFSEQYNIYFVPLFLHFIIINYKYELNKKNVAYAILLSGVIINGIGIAEFFAGKNLIGTASSADEYLNYFKDVYRTNGPFPEGIGYSTIALLYVPFAYFTFKENIIGLFSFCLLFLIFSVGFVATYSRATIICYFIILIIIFSSSNLKSLTINSILFLFLFLIVFFLWRILTASSDLYAQRLTNQDTVLGRWNQYMECLHIFISNPILGIGYGVYKKTHVYFIHNSFLKDLVELGFIGFILHIPLVFYPVFSQLKNSLNKNIKHLKKTIYSFLIILMIVPNTIDLIANQYFNIAIFLMTAFFCYTENLLSNNQKPIV